MDGTWYNFTKKFGFFGGTIQMGYCQEMFNLLLGQKEGISNRINIS